MAALIAQPQKQKTMEGKKGEKELQCILFLAAIGERKLTQSYERMATALKNSLSLADSGISPSTIQKAPRCIKMIPAIENREETRS